jgi:crotonobetainyl-CoA:carnitine CoA-transferase CaiB-like acyl-CoA transferase
MKHKNFTSGFEIPPEGGTTKRNPFQQPDIRDLNSVESRVYDAAQMSPPLEGIRVIDFGRFIAGPYCAMMLADFGADVIRVERRDGGEDRTLGPVSETGEGGLFLNVNRNKRGITLDPAQPPAKEIIRRLVASADIVVANLPIEVMRRIGLDYDSLRAIKADIILVMASAFGPDGPYKDRVGFDGVVQAMSGSMSLTGFPGPPVRSIVSWVDYGTALHGAFAAMAALYHRDRTGKGQLVDVSLLATGLTFMMPLLAERETMGIIREQQGNTGYYASPSDVYQTRDGRWIIVPTIGDPMFRRWARLVGREDLIDDPHCRDDITRGNNAPLINEVMIRWCSERTIEEALADLERARIPGGPVYELDEVLDDAQLKARGLIEHVNLPGGSKSVPISAAPARLSETPPRLRRRAPMLGEHTDEVLRELGFSSEEIASLRDSKVI